MGMGLQDSTRDRLSELPDSLILIILSFLDMEDVVSTTLLSKRWNNLWTNVPCLHFKFYPYNHDIYEHHPFIDFVNKALALWKGTKILKFRLDFMVDTFEYSSDIDSWLLFAIDKQVDDLHVQFYGYSAEDEFYAPHQRLYSCSSITNLSLDRCTLRIDCGESVQWNCLKSLSIECPEPWIEEDVLHRILRGTPHLEVLNLDFKYLVGDGDLNIESTSLKMLKINRDSDSDVYEEENTILRIVAPNLETLEISAVPFSRCLLNVPSLTNAVLRFWDPDYINSGLYYHDISLEEILRQVFQSIRRVEKLTLSSWCLKVIGESAKKEKFVEFSNVKILKFKVSTSHEILDVLEMCPNLMMLIVEHENSGVFTYPSDYDRMQLLSSLDHLRTVEISWRPSDTSIIPVIEILLQKAIVLEKMVFRYKYGVRRSLFLAEERLMSIPRSSSNAELIIIKPK